MGVAISTKLYCPPCPPGSVVHRDTLYGPTCTAAAGYELRVKKPRNGIDRGGGGHGGVGKHGHGGKHGDASDVPANFLTTVNQVPARRHCGKSKRRDCWGVYAFNSSELALCVDGYGINDEWGVLDSAAVCEYSTKYGSTLEQQCDWACYGGLPPPLVQSSVTGAAIVTLTLAAVLLLAAGLLTWKKFSAPKSLLRQSQDWSSARQYDGPNCHTERRKSAEEKGIIVELSVI